MYERTNKMESSDDSMQRRLFRHFAARAAEFEGENDKHHYRANEGLNEYVEKNRPLLVGMAGVP